MKLFKITSAYWWGRWQITGVNLMGKIITMPCLAIN
jgi:hypothetical protein